MLDFLNNYDSAVTAGQLSVPDFIDLMFFIVTASIILIMAIYFTVEILLRGLFSAIRFVSDSLRESGKRKNKYMNLLIDGCDDDILFFTDGTWLYRHEFRGLYEGVSPDKLAEMVFIVVTPFHDGYDDFVAATESLVCL